MQFPYTCTGSLSPSFLPARDVSLPVKRPFAFTLYMGRLPIGLRAPLEASVTLLEATTPVKLPTKQCPPNRVLGLRQQKGRISRTAPQVLAYLIHSLRPILHIRCPSPVLSCSKGSRGLFVPLRGNRHLHRYYNFTELTAETVLKSLHHSCRSELTRQGISLP